MRHVVSLFDRTGVMVRPWLENGYRAITVDLKPAAYQHNHREHIVADVRELPAHFAAGADIVFAFPPCDHLAVSGARWMKDKGLQKLIDALILVERARVICETASCKWMLENPVGTLATYWRKPDYIFHPMQYRGFELSDNYLKKTCLWTGGGFRMPPPNYGDVDDEPSANEILKYSPSDDRQDLRSATPPGFASAVFKANAKHHRERIRHG